MKFFQSKIDRLVAKVHKLEIKKQKAEDMKNNRNSALGRKIKKCEDLWQIYQDKSYVNENETKALIEEYDREINKAKKQIKLEKEYYDDIIAKEQKKVNKDEQNNSDR